LIYDHRHSSHSRLHSHRSKHSCKSLSRSSHPLSIGSQTGPHISPILDPTLLLDPPATTDSSPSSALRLHDMRCLHALQSVATEGVPCNITDVPFDDASTYETRASIKASSSDIDMAHVVYRLQDDDDLNNVVLMIDSNAVDVKKNDDDLVNVVSMIDSTLDNMEKNYDDCVDVVSMIDSTVDDTKKNNDDSSNVVSMIDADAASTQNNDDLNNVVLMIDADTASTQHDDEPSNYRNHYDTVEDFSQALVDRILQHLCSQDEFPLCTTLIAPERCSSFDNHPSATQLCLHNLHHIAALWLITGEGLSSVEFAAAVSEHQKSDSTEDIYFIIHRLQSSMMTNEEQALPKLTQQ